MPWLDQVLVVFDTVFDVFFSPLILSFLLLLLLLFALAEQAQPRDKGGWNHYTGFIVIGDGAPPIYETTR
jgi:hypothetical protein